MKGFASVMPVIPVMSMFHDHHRARSEDGPRNDDDGARNNDLDSDAAVGERQRREQRGDDGQDEPGTED